MFHRIKNKLEAAFQYGRRLTRSGPDYLSCDASRCTGWLFLCLCAWTCVKHVGARFIMVMINVKETSEVSPWSMIKKTSGYSKILIDSLLQMSSFHVVQHYTSHMLLGSFETRLQHLPAEGGKLPCTPQGALPELSAQSTVKHWHSGNKRVLTWESVTGGLRCCLCFRIKKIRWVLFALSQ